MTRRFVETVFGEIIVSPILFIFMWICLVFIGPRVFYGWLNIMASNFVPLRTKESILNSRQIFMRGCQWILKSMRHV